MLCFFCKSNDHFSYNCNIHASDKSRKKILREKNCCQKCLGISDTFGADSEWCEYCKFRRKCYSCFSRNHFPDDCINGYTINNFFPPNIDHDLLSRYLKLLRTEEKCFLRFTYPKISNLIHPKPVKIYYTKYIVFPTYRTFPNSDLVVVNKAEFRKGVDIAKCLNPKKFRIHKMEFIRSKLSADEFLRLLSIKTKALKCTQVQFYPQLTFREILKAAPKLQKFDVTHSNIKITKTWLDDLILLNNAVHLKYNHLKIPNLKFNVKNLADLLKDKHANISLIYRWPRNKVFGKAAFENLTNHLLSHFVWDKFIPSQLLQISFKYKSNGRNCIETVNYRLKDA